MLKLTKSDILEEASKVFSTEQTLKQAAHRRLSGQTFKLGQYPTDFESCDWQCEHRGRKPAFGDIPIMLPSLVEAHQIVLCRALSAARLRCRSAKIHSITRSARSMIDCGIERLSAVPFSC